MTPGELAHRVLVIYVEGGREATEAMESMLELGPEPDFRQMVDDAEEMNERYHPEDENAVAPEGMGGLLERSLGVIP